MRYSAEEKYEIIRLVEESSLSVKQTLAESQLNSEHRMSNNELRSMRVEPHPKA